MKVSVIVLLLFCVSLLHAQHQYGFTDAFPNLPSFNSPVYITGAGDSTNRLFVVEQAGIIWEFPNSPDVSTPAKFLDIHNKVNYGGEMGLLSVAFHPNFASNGYIYVDYVAADPLRTVIARFTVSPSTSNQVDTSTEYIIMEIPQPFENHKGGLVMFGPDGYLYIGMGDGGSGGDPFGNAQNLSVLLGKMLCINVDSTQDTLHYAIPPDNPFVGNSHGYREEIWAYGLRNPWRYSFDTQTGYMYCADVGQDKFEEVDILQKGKNYGWNITEGLHCYASSHCDTAGLTQPIIEYPHPKGECIIGGYVYRGQTMPSMTGVYWYTDYITSLFWSLQYDGTRATNAKQQLKTKLNITSFGQDDQKELYAVSAGDGRLYRFIAERCPTFLVQKYRTLSTDNSLSDKSVKIQIKNGMLNQTPNASTALELLFKKLNNKDVPLLGIKQNDRTSANQYAWISYMKVADLAKLYTILHDSIYYPLDSLRNASTIKMKGKIKATRAKNDNAAIEQGVLFRLNILLSDSGITPSGFGDLTLDTSVMLAGRQLKGYSLRSIASYFDSVMTYWQSYGITGVSAYAGLKTFVETVLRPINNTFARQIVYTGADYAVDNLAMKKNPYAITLGGIRTAAETGIVKEAPNVEPASSFSVGNNLHQSLDFSIYPNPFNPTTTFGFHLSNASKVSLKIYNTVGQEVATLVNNEKDAGEYSVVWNAANSPSGIYFAQLTVAGESRTKKLMLVK